MTTRYQKAADALRARMELFRLTVEKAKEMGDTSIELDIRAFWESEDQAAIDEFDHAKTELTGARPLFKDIAS